MGSSSTDAAGPGRIKARGMIAIPRVLGAAKGRARGMLWKPVHLVAVSASAFRWTRAREIRYPCAIALLFAFAEGCSVFYALK